MRLKFKFSTFYKTINLEFAYFDMTKMYYASLRNADLMDAFFSGGIYMGVDFTGAKIRWTTFSCLDLSNCYGLKKCKHIGPSTIGIDRLIISGNKLPPFFFF